MGHKIRIRKNETMKKRGFTHRFIYRAVPIMPQLLSWLLESEMKGESHREPKVHSLV